MSYYDDYIDGDWVPVKVPYVCPKCGRRITTTFSVPMPEVRCWALVPRLGVRLKGQTRRVPCDTVMVRADRPSRPGNG